MVVDGGETPDFAVGRVVCADFLAQSRKLVHERHLNISDVSRHSSDGDPVAGQPTVSHSCLIQPHPSGKSSSWAPILPVVTGLLLEIVFESRLPGAGEIPAC